MVIRSGISEFSALYAKSRTGRFRCGLRNHSGSVLLLKTALAVKAGRAWALRYCSSRGRCSTYTAGGDHAVGHLAALVGALAVVGFKVHVSGDSVHTGAGVRFLHRRGPGCGPAWPAPLSAHALTVRGSSARWPPALRQNPPHQPLQSGGALTPASLALALAQRHGGGVDIIPKPRSPHRLGFSPSLLALLGPTRQPARCSVRQQSGA